MNHDHPQGSPHANPPRLHDDKIEPLHTIKDSPHQGDVTLMFTLKRSSHPAGDGPGLVASLLLALIVFATSLSAQTPLGTAFTYQGSLKDGGIPATGTYDFSFSLFDAETAGTQIGSTVTASNIAVAQGLFSVSLDFGASAFAEDTRWLQIAVGPNGGALTTLTPRREIKPAPQARFAVEAATATMAGDADTLDGLDSTDLLKPKASFAATLSAPVEISVPPPFQTIIFDVVIHNHGNCYNSTTGRFTAPEDGVYLFNFWVYNPGTDDIAYLMINGSKAAFFWHRTSYATGNLTHVVALSSGDVVSLDAYLGSFRPGNGLSSPLDGPGIHFSGVQLY